MAYHYGIIAHELSRVHPNNKKQREALRRQRCERCRGVGIDRLNWTLEAARLDPDTFHSQRIAATYAAGSRGIVLQAAKVVNANSFRPDGLLKCVKCGGSGSIASAPE